MNKVTTNTELSEELLAILNVLLARLWTVPSKKTEERVSKRTEQLETATLQETELPGVTGNGQPETSKAEDSVRGPATVEATVAELHAERQTRPGRAE